MTSSDFAAVKDEYENRYQHSYMDDFGHDNRARVCDFMRAVVPSSFSGNILDFGTGNGRYAALLRRLFPSAKIFATDVSDAAVEVASRVHAGSGIVLLHYVMLDGYRGFFDLVFSNHVLEHVYNLADVAEFITKLVRPCGQMVHTMPCGNVGSLEYKIVHVTKGGIREHQGGSYFFEDPGHLRRITSDDLSDVFRPYGYKANKTWFNCQFWGAVDWITQSPPSAWRIASPLRAKSMSAAIYLLALKVMLLTFCALRISASLPRTHGHVDPKHRGVALNVVLALLKPLYWFGKPTDTLLLKLADREWVTRCRDPHGSGQFMHFRHIS